MIDAKQLRREIIRPVLTGIGHWSEAAENLLMGTAAQESHLGKYVVQVRGPAKGIFQMEPATHNDILYNWLFYPGREELKNTILDVTGSSHFSDRLLVYNIAYAAAMTRMHYLRVPSKLPAANDLEGLARYWKMHYNTYLGAGTEEQFLYNYERFVD